MVGGGSASGTASNWDETLRLAASIRAGTVNASVMLRKLAGFPRQNPVARSLREIGRIERTLFMLDWFDDPDQRRRTGTILNKGDGPQRARARHLLQPPRRTARPHLREPAPSRLRTDSRHRAVRHLRGSGVDVPDELLVLVAPLGWEHIGLTGDYLWSEMEKPRERFRPLRLHQTGRDA